jgi:hypothetical protein
MGDSIVNHHMALAILGFLVGGTITVAWDLKSDSSGVPAELEASSLTEERPPSADRSAHRRSVERPAGSASTPHQASASPPVASARSEKERMPVVSTKAEKKQPAAAVKTASVAMPVKPKPVADAPPTAPAVTRVSEGSRSVSIQVHRILVGGQLVSNGIVSTSVLDRYGEDNKYIVYFDLSVTAESDQSVVHLTHEDFRLEDSQGTIYPPLELSGQLSTVLEKGESVRGGIAYAIPNDGAPARLHFRTRDQSYTPLPTSIFEPGSSRSG